ncbi:hypothetical protein ACIQWR_25730 [Streptomyces sp. NPDC098789]|uniref:hypothetical protein n=1 Tax=Streptomyces sp. NPDC098789 TaxID=3366098 RepID=UPI00382248B0
MTGGTEDAEARAGAGVPAGPVPWDLAMTQALLGGGAIAAAQVVLWGLWELISIGTRDDYEQPIEGAFLLICCMGPFVAVLGSFLHALAFTLPVAALARLGADRTRVRAQWWMAAGLVLLAAGYAWLIGQVAGLPFGWTWTRTAAFGVIPLAGVAYAARRGSAGMAMVRATGWVLGVALVFGFGGGIIATEAGWPPPYVPPRLERTEYVAQWTGDDGASVTLRADGSAVAERLPRPWPAQESGTSHCSGMGTWQFREEGSDGRHETRFLRDGIVLTLPSCGGDQDWQVAGTAEHPELFAAVGAEAADLRILRRG